MQEDASRQRYLSAKALVHTEEKLLKKCPLRAKAVLAQLIDPAEALTH